MPIQTLTRGQWATLLLVTAGLSATLALGFIPTARELIQTAFAWAHQPFPKWGELLGFPLLAFLFYVSLPRRETAPASLPWQRLWATLPVPVAIAFVYGLIRGGAPFKVLFGTGPGLISLAWFVVAIPLGEELLFRGWLYRIAERLWPDKMGSLTNPLPAAVWSSAIGFSLWHLQNFGQEPWAIVVLQMVYTFFTGLWLGYLRWRSGRLLLPIAAHSLLNLATALA